MTLPRHEHSAGLKQGRFREIWVPLRRWMLPRDLPRVLEIEQINFPVPWDKMNFARVLRRAECRGVVLELCGAVAGYTIYEVKLRATVLLNLSVAPHLFRRGLGTLLVRKIQEDGHGPIAVDVSENNVEAMAFFNHLKFGHRRGDVRRHFFDDDQDAFHFVWKRTGR